jgi:hypothetical protein
VTSIAAASAATAAAAAAAPTATTLPTRRRHRLLLMMVHHWREKRLHRLHRQPRKRHCLPLSSRNDSSNSTGVRNGVGRRSSSSRSRSTCTAAVLLRLGRRRRSLVLGLLLRRLSLLVLAQREHLFLHGTPDNERHRADAARALADAVDATDGLAVVAGETQ